MNYVKFHWINKH